MGDHDYAMDPAPLKTPPNLSNSMCAGTSQDITIPVSLSDFVRRQRFDVAFDLLVEALGRLEKSVQTQDTYVRTYTISEAFKLNQSEISLHVKTVRSIINKVKSENDE